MEEANKEQALRCRDLGVVALDSGDYKKALRLLEKSNRMYTEPSTMRLIEKATTMAATCNGTTAASHNSNSSEPIPSSTTDRSAAASPQTDPTNQTSTAHSSHTQYSSYPDQSDTSKLHSKFMQSQRQQSPTINQSPSPSANASANTNKSSTASTTSSFNNSSSGTSNSNGSTTIPPVATKAQEDLCKRILDTKDHYAVLGVAKDATDEQIKKAYKKLAFQLHPDKNKARNAEDAFKKISKAFQCLSDTNKRTIYDQFGNDADVPQQYRSQYEADFMTPEELFEAFFGVDFGGARRRQHAVHTRRFRRPNSNDPQTRFAGLLQVLPIFILLAITILSSFMNQQPAARYEFTKSSDYPVGRTSNKHQIQYYVPVSIANEHPQSRSRHDLDLDVEIAYFASKCGREQNEKTRLLNAANSKSSSERRRIIESLKKTTDSCREYETLRSAYYKRKGLAVY